MLPTLPSPKDVLIQQNGSIPFVVTHVDDGTIYGETPDGIQVAYPLEADLHELTEADL